MTILLACPPIPKLPASFRRADGAIALRGADNPGHSRRPDPVLQTIQVLSVAEFSRHENGGGCARDQPVLPDFPDAAGGIRQASALSPDSGRSSVIPSGISPLTVLVVDQ